MSDGHPPNADHDIRRWRNTGWLVVVLISAVGIRLTFAWIYSHSPLGAMRPRDTSVYLELGRAIASLDLNNTLFAYVNPLYGLVLAPLAKLGLDDLTTIALLQTAFEAVSVLLIYFIGECLFGPRPALLAAALYASYGIMIFYSAVALPVTVTVLTMLLLVATLIWCREKAAERLWMLPGALLGILALARPNALLLAPVVVAWGLFSVPATSCSADGLLRDGDATAQKWTYTRQTLIITAGIAGVLFPFSLLSSMNGRGLSPFPANGGINFFIGNHAEANGRFEAVPGVSSFPIEQVRSSIAEASTRSGHPLSPAEASSFWLERGFDWMRHAPEAAVLLMLKKLVLFLRAEEIPLNINYNFVKEVLPFLSGTISFGALLPLSVAGMIAIFLVPAGPRDPRSLLLLLLFTVYTLSVAIFFVCDRYRLPIVPLLAIFAGYGIDFALRTIRQRRVSALALGGAVLAALLVNYPFAAFNYAPNAEDYYELGTIYRERGENSLAIAQFRRAAELDPETPNPLLEIATTFFMQKSYGAAEAVLRDTLARFPTSDIVRNNLAVLSKQKNAADH